MDPDLEKQKIQEMYEWVDDVSDKVPFSRPKKNFARDFSDGVLVAELLKYYYPKLVDLHNYNAANSHALKLGNWITLNRKVLPKLGLHLTNNLIEELSKANPRAVEKLLLELKEKVDSVLNDDVKQSPDSSSQLSEYQDDIVKVPISPGADGEKVYKKMVPLSLLEKKILEMKDRDRIISALQKRVQHLESMVALKESRIQDLTTQLYRPERAELAYKNIKRATCD